MKKYITYKDLVAMDPCYTPEEIGIPEGYRATVYDFIQEYRGKVKNPEDIIWVVCRNDYTTGRDMRLFAVWCARESLKLVEDPDPRSIEACNVAERYANKKATKRELVAAWAAARDAAWAAAWAAALAAARDAAGTAAGTAARTAVRAAVRTAVRAAQIDKLLTYFK